MAKRKRGLVGIIPRTTLRELLVLRQCLRPGMDTRSPVSEDVGLTCAAVERHYRGKQVFLSPGDKQRMLNPRDNQRLLTLRGEQRQLALDR